MPSASPAPAAPAPAPAPSAPAPSAPSAPAPALPFPFSTAPPSHQPILITRGAEALLYQTSFLTPSLPCALKFRPSKPYRHAVLDARLTRHRILAEARVLVKLRREGVAVPGLYALDWERGWLLMEWVGGGSVRGVLDVWLVGLEGLEELEELEEEEEEEEELEEGGGEQHGDEAEAEGGRGRGGRGRGGRRGRAGRAGRAGGMNALLGLMRAIGRLVGQMHQAGVVHGDLTTSNLMLRGGAPGRRGGEAAHELDGEVMLIDFGLAAQSVQDEDRAVDLYVLERAFGSTHPRTEHLWLQVLEAYGSSYKGARATLKKFEEVRMRGRKKIMVG